MRRPTLSFLFEVAYPSVLNSLLAELIIWVLTQPSSIWMCLPGSFPCVCFKFRIISSISNSDCIKGYQISGIENKLEFWLWKLSWMRKPGKYESVQMELIYGMRPQGLIYLRWLGWQGSLQFDWWTDKSWPTMFSPFLSEKKVKGAFVTTIWSR